MLLSTKVAIITLAVLYFRAAVSQRPILWADTNRDGAVNEADEADRAFWTPFREQSSSPVSATPFIVVQISTSREPFEQPGARILQRRLQTSIPQARLGRATEELPIDVAGDVFTQIYATPEAAAKRLKAGMYLGIDGREHITDTLEWDGKVTVHFDLHVNTSIFSNAVQLKVTPVLTHHHLQRVETLISTAANESHPVQLESVRQLDKGRAAAGLQTPLYLFNRSSDIWAQVYIEPAYATISGPNSAFSIRIILRSAQSTRTGGRQVFEQLRGKGMGGFQPKEGHRGVRHLEINSFKNLETVPPYSSKSGIRYPVGRMIQVKDFEKMPAESITRFFNK
ncbi:hypothetical protein CNYM01_05451 [Colletotrichum nymphaeae SA-01]|uniref:Protein-arginine deiminase C-terminal domain-containing protein n=1 Tax=Colletotrichum nymphaeae SA-01 TaxID=1460502 RepID=A0A135SYQ6_9PEZI|nr:hypothetical protein CNYM01_05451 [Colletotrichum nymphaeae SA-01]